MTPITARTPVFYLHLAVCKSAFPYEKWHTGLHIKKEVILKEEQKRLNFRVPKTIYKELIKLSIKDEKSLSELVRCLLERQLSIEKTKQDEDVIRTYLRAELEPLIKGQINRLAKIMVKGSATSASSWLLLVYANLKRVQKIE